MGSRGREEPGRAGTAAVGSCVIIDESSRTGGGILVVVWRLEMGVESHWKRRLIPSIALHEHSKPVIPHLLFLGSEALNEKQQQKMKEREKKKHTLKHNHHQQPDVSSLFKNSLSQCVCLQCLIYS